MTIADAISNSDNITQIRPLEYQTPQYNKRLHQISPRCLIPYTIGYPGLNIYYHLTTCPSSPQLTYDMTIDYNKTDGLSTTTRKLTGHNSRKTSAQTTIPTNIHTANIIFTNIIVMEDKHNIPNGKMHSNCRLLPDHIVCKIKQINNIRIQLSNS